MTTMTIDWTVFDGKPENICVCRCVYDSLEDGDEVPTFMSHVKYTVSGLVARKPCPRCGSHTNLRSASTGWHRG